MKEARVRTIDELHKAQIKGYTRTRKGKLERVKPYESARQKKMEHLLAGKPEKLGEPFSATSKQMEHELHRMSTMSDKALATRVYKIGNPDKLIRFYAIADQLQKPELKALIKKIGWEKFGLKDAFEPMSAWEKKKSPKEKEEAPKIPPAFKHTKEAQPKSKKVTASAIMDHIANKIDKYGAGGLHDKWMELSLEERHAKEIAWMKEKFDVEGITDQKTIKKLAYALEDENYHGPAGYFYDKMEGRKKLGEPIRVPPKQMKEEFDELSEDEKDTYEMLRDEKGFDHSYAMKKINEWKSMPKHDPEDMMYQVAAGKSVIINTIDELFKAQIKPFTRTRKGKIEHVKGYSRVQAEGQPFKVMDTQAIDLQIDREKAEEEENRKKQMGEVEFDEYIDRNKIHTTDELNRLYRESISDKRVGKIIKEYSGKKASKKWGRSVGKLKRLEEKKLGSPFSTKPKTPEEHQIKIAKDTLKMPDAMAGVMGGPSKEEAKEILKDYYSTSVGSSFSTKEKTGPRAVHMIAQEIASDWKKPYFGAVPYLNAMHALETIDTPYGADSGASVIAYFLANAQTWRGETAKRVKKELNAMLKATYKKSMEDEMIDELVKAESRVKSYTRNVNGKIVNVREHQRYKLKGMLNFIRNYKEAGATRGSTLKKLQDRFGLSTEMAHRVHRLAEALGGSLFKPFPVK